MRLFRKNIEDSRITKLIVEGSKTDPLSGKQKPAS